MNAIWFLSRERNLAITGFNRTNKDDEETELWVKEQDGSSRKLAQGDDAIKLEEALIGMLWSSAPCIISDSNGGFASNVDTRE